MKILITGADGFIGKNLNHRLISRSDMEVKLFVRSNHESDISSQLEGIDFVFHLAGSNRPENPNDFITNNVDLTKSLCNAIKSHINKTGKKISLVLASSIQSIKDTPYGKSKLAAEKFVFTLAEDHSVKTYIYRLPNIFGKWCRPNYNSVVATFCHNIARDIPIQIDNPSTLISLVYVEDLIDSFMRLIDNNSDEHDSSDTLIVRPEYSISLGELAILIRKFKDSRKTLILEKVGTGLMRALYSTYISYLPTESFKYSIPSYKDSRGSFIEMIKTQESGQISFFSAHPGVTRGSHYHNSKTEKFLVAKGKASFKFKNLATGENFELETSDDNPEIVETIPGWAHSITNVGNDEMIVILWANEILNKNKPDTYQYAI
jgi:UDP-2-acetamido-2,6-beta-L-arabino-hexul-4-ose reductase